MTATDQRFPAEKFSTEHLALQRTAFAQVNEARTGKARFNDQEVAWLGRIQAEGLWKPGYTDFYDCVWRQWRIPEMTARKVLYQNEFIRNASAALWGRPADVAPRLYASGEDARECQKGGRLEAIQWAVRYRDAMATKMATMSDGDLRPLLQNCFRRGIETVRYEPEQLDDEDADESPPIPAPDQKPSNVVPITSAPSSSQRAASVSPEPAPPPIPAPPTELTDKQFAELYDPRADQGEIHELIRALLKRIGMKPGTTLYIYAPGERCGPLDSSLQNYHWDLETDPGMDLINSGSFRVDEIEEK